MRFYCLRENDVVTAKVSDHHPVLHDNVLFWNVMMQGKRRNKDNIIQYNNGLNLEESDGAYLRRLFKIAAVICEIIFIHPEIEIISLCEGPIHTWQQKKLLAWMRPFSFMKKFMNENHFKMPRDVEEPDWGLLMLADAQYQITPEHYLEKYLKTAQPIDSEMENKAILKRLVNRFQLWKLENQTTKKYFALGHFPFGGDVELTEKSQLSKSGQYYTQFIKTLLSDYRNDQLILSSDFNFNPYLLTDEMSPQGYQIPANNSVVVEQKNTNEQKAVTVDGIILSQRERQRYVGLHAKLGLFVQYKLAESPGFQERETTKKLTISSQEVARTKRTVSANLAK